MKKFKEWCKRNFKMNPLSQVVLNTCWLTFWLIDYLVLNGSGWFAIPMILITSGAIILNVIVWQSKSKVQRVEDSINNFQQSVDKLMVTVNDAYKAIEEEEKKDRQLNVSIKGDKVSFSDWIKHKVEKE